MMVSSAGMGLSLAALGLIFALHAAAAMLVLGLILCYVACFAVGLGPAVWVMLAELFPTRIRARAMAVATVTLWGACLLISSTFLSLVKATGPAGAFWIYAALCMFAFVFLWRAVPETKGKTLEEIERTWQRSR
jgi:MFS family permease